MCVASGYDGLSRTFPSLAGNLYVEFLLDALLQHDADAVLGYVLLAGLQRLWGKVLQDLQLVLALPNQGSQGDGNGQAYHASARNAYSHGVLQDVGTQLGLYVFRTAA